MNKGFFIILAILLVIEVYAYQAIRHYFANSSTMVRSWTFWIYVGLSILIWVSFFSFKTILSDERFRYFRLFVTGLFFLTTPPKIFISLFLLIDDLARGFKWLYLKVVSKPQQVSDIVQQVGHGISRNDFIVNTALGSGA